MVKTSKLPEVDRSLALPDVADFSDKLKELLKELRDQILAPQPRKNPPFFTSSQVAELCGIDRTKLNYLANREEDDLPKGTQQGTGRSRLFSLAEAREWVQKVSSVPPSPLLTTGVADGHILLVAQLKGGSSKTTLSMCLAQGLSLRGRKVLVVDLDPQASMTELCGLYADKEITDDSTVLNYICDPENRQLKEVVQPTYWDGVDIIPAHPSLFGAEFHIPSLVQSQPNTRFWAILQKGLEPLRKDYDYIILDTAPSLSYVTINALIAADAMVMPLVPESLDFVSSVSFWNLFSDMTPTFLKYKTEKEYKFISVVLSKVDYGPNSSASVVRAWAQRAYGDWLSPIEIPASSAMSSGALALSTVFDLTKWEGNQKTLYRVKQPLEAYCKWVDEQFIKGEMA